MSDLDRLALQFWLSLNPLEREHSKMGPPAAVMERYLARPYFEQLNLQRPETHESVAAECRRAISKSHCMGPARVSPEPAPAGQNSQRSPQVNS